MKIHVTSTSESGRTVVSMEHVLAPAEFDKKEQLLIDMTWCVEVAAGNAPWPDDEGDDFEDLEQECEHCMPTEVVSQIKGN